jgi:hypothetical protein
MRIWIIWFVLRACMNRFLFYLVSYCCYFISFLIIYESLYAFVAIFYL